MLRAWLGRLTRRSALSAPLYPSPRAAAPPDGPPPRSVAKSPRARSLTRTPRNPNPDPNSLGEHRLRELNDEINKLFRTKSHWEKQIAKLGGRNHSLSAPKVT